MEAAHGASCTGTNYALGSRTLGTPPSQLWHYLYAWARLFPQVLRQHTLEGLPPLEHVTLKALAASVH